MNAFAAPSLESAWVENPGTWRFAGSDKVPTPNKIGRDSRRQIVATTNRVSADARRIKPPDMPALRALQSRRDK